MLHGNRGTGLGRWVKAAYTAAGAGERVSMSGETTSADEVVKWLLRCSPHRNLP